jgi:type IV pilus assembly protein PilC
MFAALHTQLPLPTRIIFETARFARIGFLPLTAGLVIVAAARTALAATNGGALLLDRLHLLMPVIGEIERKKITGSFLRATWTLIIGGVKPSKAIEIAAKSIKNTAIRRKLAKGPPENGKITDILIKMNIMPPILVQMIEKSTGSSDFLQILEKASHFYEEEVDATVDALNSIIEPALILMVGIFVAAILTGIYMPMLSVSM